MIIIRLFRRALSLALIMLFIVNMTGLSLTAFAANSIYKSGRYVYIGDLKAGDFLEEGMILYPDSSRGYGITFATLNIDYNESISLSESVTPKYVCGRKFKVIAVTPSPYSKYLCTYDLETYNESFYIQPINRKNSHIYVGDMKIGDITGAGCTLHSTSADKGYRYFQIFLDGSEAEVNENGSEWSPSAPVRLVDAHPWKYNSANLVMYFETFYDQGEVGTEAALNASLNSNDVIVLANNIELSDCFFVRDNKAHILDLNGYTLSRRIEGKPATGHVFQVNKGSKLTIKDSSDDGSGLITGGCAPNGGANIDGELVLEGCIISGNTADNGAGIYTKGTLMLTDSTVSGSQGNCGIFFDSDNKLTLKNSTITGNAGGIYMNAGSIVLAGGKTIVYRTIRQLYS